MIAAYVYNDHQEEVENVAAEAEQVLKKAPGTQYTSWVYDNATCGGSPWTCYRI